MREHALVWCPECDHHLWFTEEYLLGLIKQIRMERVRLVAHNMATKSGPYYEKWLAAMEARGPQKRCKDCQHIRPSRCCTRKSFIYQHHVFVNSGQYACGGFQQKS